MMLNKFVELSTHEEEVDIKEMDLLGENLGQLIERCWQGTFSSQVLDGVAGHLLELVGKEESRACVRNSFLRALLFLASSTKAEDLRALLFLASSTEAEDWERLGEEYASHLDKLVDWLYICGDFTTQLFWWNSC